MIRFRFRRCRYAALVCLALAPALAPAQVPQWIWSSTENRSTNKEVRYFRRTFTAKDGLILSSLAASGDDSAEIFINGVKVASVDNWAKPKYVDVTKRIVPGENVIAARCQNEVSDAGLIVRLEMTMPTLGSVRQTYNPAQHAGLHWIDTVITDSKWLYSDQEASNWTQINFDDSAWKPAVTIA